MDYEYPDETSVEKNQLDRKLSEKELISKFLELAKVEEYKKKELLESEVSLVEIFNRPSHFGLTELQSNTIKELKFIIDWEGGESYETKSD